MSVGQLVSVNEYLSTSYRPDCDYVDGVVLERNLGEADHSAVQRQLIGFFYMQRKEWGVQVFPEQRVQVSPTRFRVPDVCVVLGEPSEQIFRTPPFICIEILSKDDRLSEMQERVEDYLRFGVPYVFILDPGRRKAHRCTMGSTIEVDELATENPEIRVPLDAIFVK
jgi:Uma2 family endonuclease